MFEQQLAQAYESLREQLPDATKIEIAVQYERSSPSGYKTEWTAKAWYGVNLYLKIGNTFDGARQRLIDEVRETEQQVLAHADRIRARLCPAPDQAAGLRDRIEQEMQSVT